MDETRIAISYNRALFHRITRFLHCVRKQWYGHANSELLGLMDELNHSLERWGRSPGLLEEVNELAMVLPMMLQGVEAGDLILIADLLEAQIKPIMRNMQVKMIQTTSVEKFVCSSEMEKCGWAIEYTSTGDYTLRCVDEMRRKPIYLHSNNDPYEEACEWASDMLKGEATHFILYGIGLGYAAQALLDSDPFLTLEVYEASPLAYRVFCEVQAYTSNVFSYQDADGKCRITVYEDNNLTKLSERLKAMDQHEAFAVCQPCERILSNGITRNWLADCALKLSSIKEQGRMLSYQYIRNRQMLEQGKIKWFHQLEDDFTDKNLFLVGSGPSLDSNVLQFKALSHGIGTPNRIVAAASAWHCLKANDIEPDYVVLTDAKPWTIHQIDGLEEEKVPILLLSTANSYIPTHYKGTCYCLLQSGWEPAEKLATQQKELLVRTGGSVMTTALDLAIQMHAARIILVGVDLAFTKERTHYSSYSLPVKKEYALQVEAIGGGMVGTSGNLNSYRLWMERRIQEQGVPEVVQATEGGAVICGTKVSTLRQEIARTSLSE